MTLELDDILDGFEIGFTIYKEFNKVEHKGKIIGYNSKHRLYEVEYEDGDKEKFYHNKIHAHKYCVKIAPSKSKKKTSKSKHSNFGKAKKKNNLKQRYRTRSWKQLQTLATNALLG